MNLKRHIKEERIFRFKLGRDAWFVITFITTIMLFLCLFVGFGSDFTSLFLLWSGYFLTALAISVGAVRSGIYGYGFWLPVIAGYPLLTPLLVQSLLGIEYFSFFARELQSVERLGEPIFVASLACIVLSICVHDPHKYNEKYRSFRRRIRKSVIGKDTACLLLVLSIPMIIIFAWATEPGRIVGQVAYRQLMDERISGLRFAGGAWVVFEVVGLAAYLSLRKRGRGLLKACYWIATFVSFVWLFLHARRSETIGFALLLFCLFRPSRIQVRQILRRWLNIRTAVFGVIVLMFSLIGYYRTTLDFSALNQDDYVQAPGGSGNNLLTYIAGFHLYKNDRLSSWPGETYWWHLVNLPPEAITSALGGSKAPSAYSVVERSIPLMGGEYWLMEPMMNFGYFGIGGYALLIGFVARSCVRKLRRYLASAATFHSFVQAATFLALIFRTLWYGPDAMINGAIMALIVGGGVQLALSFSRASGHISVRALQNGE